MSKELKELQQINLKAKERKEQEKRTVVFTRRIIGFDGGEKLPRGKELESIIAQEIARLKIDTGNDCKLHSSNLRMNSEYWKMMLTINFELC